MSIYEWSIFFNLWDCASGPALGLHYTTSSSTCTAELFSDLHKHSDKSAWVCIHAPSQEMGRRVREAERGGGGGVNGGDGGERENKRDAGASEGGETERWGERERGGMQPTERTGKSCEVAGGTGREKSQLHWGGGMSAAASPPVRLSLYVSVCLSVCLPLSSLIVSPPGCRCNVAVSAVKVLAGGISLNEPWLCAVSVCRSAAVLSTLTQLCRQPAGLWVNTSCREQVGMTKTYHHIMFVIFYIQAGIQCTYVDICMQKTCKRRLHLHRNVTFYCTACALQWLNVLILKFQLKNFFLCPSSVCFSLPSSSAFCLTYSLFHTSAVGAGRQAHHPWDYCRCNIRTCLIWGPDTQTAASRFNPV